ncbi:hypothetical protein S245_020006, partial [Arachis hypogaea]
MLFSYPFASYTSANFTPGASPRLHALLLLLSPPSTFFFRLFATVSNIVIREILLGATTRLSRATLHGYKEGFIIEIEMASFLPMIRLALEDLYHLIKKAVSIKKHLERNRKDKDSKFKLILVESRIYRLARYYKKTNKLPPDSTLIVSTLLPVVSINNDSKDQLDFSIGLKVILS